MSYILHKLAPGWGMPSLSPACIQAEALLRFTGADFSVVATNEPGKSPTGCLPCLERDQNITNASYETGEFDATREVITFLQKQGDDADAPLTNSERAVAGAFVRLLQNDLEPATLYAAWLEKEGYKEYRKAFAGSMPFPLNYLVPFQQRCVIQKSLKGSSPDEVFKAAESAIDSMASFLNRSSENTFCFGDSPTTLDAVLYGHLLFYNLSPVVPPVLKKKLDEHGNLKSFVDRISSDYFTDVAPVPPARVWTDMLEQMESFWSPAAQGQKSKLESDDREDSPEDKRLKKWGRVWLGCAVTLLLSYAWYYPPPVQLVTLADLEDDDDDEV